MRVCWTGGPVDLISQTNVLACDDENESVRHRGSVPVTPGQSQAFPAPIEIDPRPTLKSWLAPVWLFGVSPMFGFRGLKEQHVPARDPDEKLDKAHTRIFPSMRATPRFI
jgi:hypothetical protein